ncbi:MAG: glycosyltransferase family 2 protein [Proteobacteria bacterium]|nr:glycosyltransferase family 2 protein [Pseudomonadota bacterium]
MLISVIIPAYNEINTISHVLKKVEDTPYNKEIIIVDDGSKDGTREYLSSRFTVHSSHFTTSANPILDEGKGGFLTDAKVIFHEKNMGKGAAIRSGIKAAKGDIIVIQDADLEYDPKDYPTLFEPIIEGKADVVYGSRFLGGTHRVFYFWHYVGNKLITLLSNMLTDLNLTDMETCYKVFKKEMLEGIRIESDRFGFEPEITAKMARKGCRIYEVPISYYGRSYEEGKKITWRDGAKAVFTIIKYNLFRK